MASSVFLDSNGWIALLNSSDSLHELATDVWRKLGSEGSHVVITDWVIAETGNGMARSQHRNRFAEAVRRVEASPSVNLVYIDNRRLQEAVLLYENRVDKSWGLVDCASFVVMAEEQISEAFTNDSHFEQAGFRCLLREN